MPSLKNDLGPLIALAPTGDVKKVESPVNKVLQDVAAHPLKILPGKVKSLDDNHVIGTMMTALTIDQHQKPEIVNNVTSAQIIAEKNHINSTHHATTAAASARASRKNGYHRSHSQYLEPNHLLHDDEEENTYENELYSDEIMLLASTNTATTTTAPATNGNGEAGVTNNGMSAGSSPSPPLIPTPIIKPASSPFKNNAANNAAAAAAATTAPEAIKAIRTSGTLNKASASGGNGGGAVVTNKSYTIDGIDASIFEPEMPRPKKIYKVVLTGGPCGGKTTGQARLCTFFENLGWKVFRVPESATVLLSGGIKFGELSAAQALRFQEDLVKTMMHIESVFFALAETVDKDVLIICDRGTMDASAFIPREQWEGILARNGWNEVDIRDTRYNHIIHMVSAANGAEPFYSIEDHATRWEGLEMACKLDQKAAQAWVGHPYFDVVDNSSDFETKVCRMIQCVCQKLGIDARDRLQTNSRKVKFLVKGPLPPDGMFSLGFQDFHVVHDYLQTSVPHPKMQARLRKRGQHGYWSYTYTVRRPELQGQVIEVKTALTQRDYNNMLTQKDHNHVTIYKHRRCFLMNDQYFQLDIYDDPCHPRCKGLILLETYSTLNGTELLQRLPSCLTIVKEVTGDPRYSMYNLSLKDKWENNKNFCLSLAGTDSEEANHSAKECRLTGT